MCTKLSGERNKGAREQYNISSPAGGIAAQAKPAIFYVCSIANSPVPTNITSYVLPPGVFICGSTAICVNRYLQKRKGFLLFLPLFSIHFHGGKFPLFPKLTVCLRASKLEVRSTAERSRPLASEF